MDEMAKKLLQMNARQRRSWSFGASYKDYRLAIAVCHYNIETSDIHNDAETEAIWDKICEQLVEGRE